MPIYAYCCENCGFAEDVLQKLSDAQLHTCPKCGKESFKKQLTAANVNTTAAGTTTHIDPPACCNSCCAGGSHGGPCG